MGLSFGSKERANIVSYCYLSANHQLVQFLRIYSVTSVFEDLLSPMKWCLLSCLNCCLIQHLRWS